MGRSEVGRSEAGRSVARRRPASVDGVKTVAAVAESVLHVFVGSEPGGLLYGVSGRGRPDAQDLAAPARAR